MLFKKFDHRRDGRLHFDEFIHCAIIAQRCKGAFTRMDTNHTGMVQMTMEQFFFAVYSCV